MKKTIDKEITWCEALALFMEGVDDIAFMVPKEIPDSLKSIRALVNDGAKFFTLKDEEKHFIEVESIEDPEEEEGDDTPPSEPEAPVKDFEALTIEEVVALPKASAEADAKADMAEEEPSEEEFEKLRKVFGVERKVSSKPTSQKDIDNVVENVLNVPNTENNKRKPYKNPSAGEGLPATKGTIKSLYEAGWKPSDIAKEVNLSQATISYHIRNMKEKGEIK